MRKGTRRNRVMGLLMAVIILASTCVLPPQTAEAASLFISVSDFSKLLASKIELSPIEGATQDGSINVLLEKGIIKDGDFSSYDQNITRGDTLVLLNRADEYLYGNKLTDKLVQTAIDKRISDIKKVDEAKRVDIAKAYLKGYMKGFSNGTYCTDRKLKLTSKITKMGAKNCINLLKDKKSRAKISPDGQLIRTTNLPISYKKWPYILASYPNSYYDWKLQYELCDGYTRNNKHYDYVNLVDYASPAQIDEVKGKNGSFEEFAEVRGEHLDEWVGKVQTYLELVFSANYKTINKEWVDNVIKTDYSYGYDIEESTRKSLESYVNDMKANKTIVEYDRIRVDGSTLYCYNDSFYLRAYVKYRINSSEQKYGVDTDTLIMEEPYNKILWSKRCEVNFTGITLEKWRECCFDIEIASCEADRVYGVCTAYLNEYYCKQFPVTK